MSGILDDALVDGFGADGGRAGHLCSDNRDEFSRRGDCGVEVDGFDAVNVVEGCRVAAPTWVCVSDSCEWDLGNGELGTLALGGDGFNLPNSSCRCFRLKCLAGVSLPIRCAGSCQENLQSQLPR